MDLRHDDGASLVRLCTAHAELHGKINHRNDNTAQVHDSNDLRRSMRDWCCRTPSANLADGRGAHAEFLIVQAKRNNLQRTACIVVAIIKAGHQNSAHSCFTAAFP